MYTTSRLNRNNDDVRFALLGGIMCIGLGLFLLVITFLELGNRLLQHTDVAFLDL